MVKLRAWFKKHIKYEVFSFMGFVFSITVFMYNIATNQIIPLQSSPLDAETIPYVEPMILYLPFIAFSAIFLVLAIVFLYFTLRGRR